jgi:hypothetical protein
VLSIYLADAGEAGNEFDDLNARIGRLNEFWGGKMLADVNSHECGAYVKHQHTSSSMDAGFINAGFMESVV